jgi:hypothetical protein
VEATLEEAKAEEDKVEATLEEAKAQQDISSVDSDTDSKPDTPI